LTLGFGPARFQTKPPACYRASWQLPGPDFHRQATTSLRTARSAATSQRHLLLCWAHEITSLPGIGCDPRVPQELFLSFLDLRPSGWTSPCRPFPSSSRSRRA